MHRRSGPGKQVWSPLQLAKEDIKKLPEVINLCDGKRFGELMRAAGSYIEAAFYEHEINEDTMNEMKYHVRKKAEEFNDVCTCLNRNTLAINYKRFYEKGKKDR